MDRGAESSPGTPSAGSPYGTGRQEVVDRQPCPSGGPCLVPLLTSLSPSPGTDVKCCTSLTVTV